MHFNASLGAMVDTLGYICRKATSLFTDEKGCQKLTLRMMSFIVGLTGSVLARGAYALLHLPHQLSISQLMLITR